MILDQRLFDAAFDNGSVGRPDDCQRICQVVFTEWGINITPFQAQEVWDAHSDMMDAGWLGISNDDEIKDAIREFVGRRLKMQQNPQ